jgi:glycogen synthase
LGDISSLREIWQDAAVFTAPDNASALAEILNGLIRNNARRCEFAARARTRALTFSPHRMGERYLGCYQSCFDPEVVEVPA